MKPNTREATLSKVAQEIKTGISGLAPADQAAAAAALGNGNIPQISTLPDAVAVVVESAYGVGVGSVFLYSVPLAVVTLLAVIFLPNAPLGRQNAVQLKNAAAKSAAASAPAAPGTGSAAGTGKTGAKSAAGSTNADDDARRKEERTAADLTLADVATGAVGLVDPLSPVETRGTDPGHRP